MMTRWSISVEESKKQIGIVLSSLDEQCPLSSALHQYGSEEHLLIHKHNLVFYGIPM